MRFAVILLLAFATETASSPKPPPFKVAPPPKPDCGFAKHVEQGDEALRNGANRAAVASYEKALRCNNDPALYMKVILAAVGARDCAKAKIFAARLTVAKQRNAAVQLIYDRCAPRGPKPWMERPD